jgi:hypothetical protein
MRITRVFFALALLLAVALSTSSAFAQQVSGAIYTTTQAGTVVNKNIYVARTDVYLNGGPQNTHSSGLPDGTYYFQVTDPSGKTLLSTDNAVCRQLTVAGGRVSGALASPSCNHLLNGLSNPANGSKTVQLAPFDLTPNQGAEYKVWLIPVGKATVSTTDSKVLVFSHSNSKTDNFKVRESSVSQNSCQPSGSLSVLIDGTNVHSYVPKGSWSSAATGVGVVNVEGLSTLPDINPILTTSVVNSCASNSVTGQTVCTANDNNVYIISGLSATPTVTTLSSAGSGTISFSQDSSCTNCGVAMDSVHNKAVIALSLNGSGGYQYLDLNGVVPTIEPAFRSQAPPFPEAGTNISENIMVDPDRNLILSPNELSNYELVDVATTTAPTFFEQIIPGSLTLDSAGEDCSTGIVLASVEDESGESSQVYIADLVQAVFTPGTPAGTWTEVDQVGAQVQTLADSFLKSGSSGIAVAQGTHTGVIAGEFVGFFTSDAITAIALPTTSGGTPPAITDWVTCNIGGGFLHGRDPHTVTAYKSPNNGHAIALLANGGATTLAVVDLTNMLDSAFVPRTSGFNGGPICDLSQLPASVVTFIPVP